MCVFRTSYVSLSFIGNGDLKEIVFYVKQDQTWNLNIVFLIFFLGKKRKEYKWFYNNLCFWVFLVEGKEMKWNDIDGFFSWCCSQNFLFIYRMIWNDPFSLILISSIHLIYTIL